MPQYHGLKITTHHLWPVEILYNHSLAPFLLTLLTCSCFVLLLTITPNLMMLRSEIKETFLSCKQTHLDQLSIVASHQARPSILARIGITHILSLNRTVCTPPPKWANAYVASPSIIAASTTVLAWHLSLTGYEILRTKVVTMHDHQ